MPFLFFLLILSAQAYSQSLPLPRGSSGKAQDFSWNGITPLALPIECSNFDITLIQEGVEKKLKRENVKEMGEDMIKFSLNSPPDYTKPAQIKLSDPSKSALFQNSKADITWRTNAPLLQLISSSSSLTKGGGALAVLKSEARSNLSFVGYVDGWEIPYYPQTFKQDGYYALIFPWYFDQSKNLGRFAAMDKAGNITEIALSSLPIAAKNRSFLEKRIVLGDDYGIEKAKELNLSPEEAKKLETNIVAINSALNQASPRSFDRWIATRSPFEKSSSQIIKRPADIFKKSALPTPPGYRITATFGDRRRYFFREKQVRESTHVGQDMALKVNMPVYSILDGAVVYADWNRGNGKTIVIDHGLGVYSFYAHNSEFKVKEGSKVTAGQQIALSGTTGQSTGDHLHLSVIAQGMYIQPAEWLSAKAIQSQYVQPLIQAEKFIIADSSAPNGGLAKPQPLIAIEPAKETWLAPKK